MVSRTCNGVPVRNTFLDQAPELEGNSRRRVQSAPSPTQEQRQQAEQGGQDGAAQPKSTFGSDTQTPPSDWRPSAVTSVACGSSSPATTEGSYPQTGSAESEISHAELQASLAELLQTSEQSTWTAVCLKHIPDGFAGQDDLTALLDDEGFRGRYNFVYLPFTFGAGPRGGCNRDTAFINLVDHDTARRFMMHFNPGPGRSREAAASSERSQAAKQSWHSWKGKRGSEVGAEVAWYDNAHTYQELIKKYANGDIVRNKTREYDDRFKPWVFEYGTRVPFPDTTP